MIREAQEHEASVVFERLAAEIANSGLGTAYPSAGAISMDIAAGQPWFIDDDDSRVVMHAHRDYGEHPDGIFKGIVAYVSQAWAGTLRHDDPPLWLANHLLARWGDLWGVYPTQGGPIAQKASAALRSSALREGQKQTWIKLSDGARILNAKAERERGRR